ncbi:hypothetical protein IT084_10120 [Desulfallas sp. Bu1-1]|uniref:hypothetical protein n=1 Tax=Desulfallas sp. Bu1-1 TaxID=2787620 RepID=UPI00189EC31D|nr:hypothetical protein [Desulfallas sp. Bu1-1]MBF7083328.1 hypothetical protein [Desulfallas sp. Bu1-1]
MFVNFIKITKESVFLDPRNNFESQTVTIEIRRDPLTERVSRIFPFRKLVLHRHDWTPFVEESKQKFCPFCPEVVEKVTPKFIEAIAPDGRIKVGDAMAIPNLNPYEKHASVVIMSPRHYIPMDEINVQTMVDSFRAGLTYLQRVTAADPAEGSYPSINWNYMPYAGGSIIHPHLQVLTGPEPTTFNRQLINASTEYFMRCNQNYWTDLIYAEIDRGERYIGKTGDVHWISAFAPRHVGEVIGILPGKQTIDDITDQDLVDLAGGLQKIIHYYDRNNLPSFNAALYFARREDRGFTVHVRIVGRFTIFPLVGSDITHMQVLHDDPWTVILPELIAQELKDVFNSPQ